MPDKRSTYIPYIPGSPPTIDDKQYIRATWDELFKIAQSLIDLDRPVSVSVRSNESIPVGATEVWERLFDEGVIADWEEPPAQLDTTTGLYTCPQSGLYQLLVTVRVPAFASPGNNSFYCSIRTTKYPLLGIQTSVIDTSGGLDDFPITVMSTGLIPCQKGDQFSFDATIVHSTQTGTSDIQAYLMVIRQSAIK